ncbi:MICOS complex subunit MIC13-like [Macrobrachium nipponense]|uniref:MICOS complex subunit MIC13-like n=1 Tax=Macrobrachium nipponense TaxID=159736 RepID=UPI0030C88B20
MNKVLKAAWFATKVGIGGGVVYITIDQGIWGNSHQSSAVYDRLYDIMPGTKKVSEKYLLLPKPDDVNVNFRSYWNSGVFYTFDFVANIPQKIGNVKNMVVGFVSSSAQSSSPADTPKPEATSKTEETPAEENSAEHAAPAETVTPPSDAPQSEEKVE